MDRTGRTRTFRWAKRRGMTTRDRIAEFEMLTSTYRSKERTPPEIDELSLLLSTAVEVTPDIPRFWSSER